jgi:hypothetical protein
MDAAPDYARVLNEDTLPVGRGHKFVEDSTVEARVVLLDEWRYFEIGRKRVRAIVRRFDPTMGGQQEDEHLLRAVGIDRAKANRNHEFC